MPKQSFPEKCYYDNIAYETMSAYIILRLWLWFGLLSTGALCLRDHWAGPHLDGHGLLAHPHPLSLVRTELATEDWDPDIRLDVNTTRLERSGDWVEVSLSGVRNPRSDDLVVLMPSSSSLDLKSTSPLKYHFAATYPGYMDSGNGTFKLRLLNIRQAQRVYFVREGLQYPRFAAQAPPIVPMNAGEPTQVHMALTGLQGEMLVQWVSGPVTSPRVLWAEEKQSVLDRTADATSQTYSRSALCAPPANASGWIDPGLLHAALLMGLIPGRRYQYIVGSDDGGWSEVSSFVSPPGPGSEVNIIASADLGQTELDGSLEVDAIAPASRHTTDRLAAEDSNATLMILNGDLSYARGYAVQWETFFDQLGPIARRMPLMTVIGNHERDWPGTRDRFGMAYDSGGECGVPYQLRTGMPAAGPDRPWYSFDYGPVHFLQYSTEHAFEPGSEQYEFIEQDLANTDRTRTPWIIVGGHRPIYIDSTFVAERPDGDQYMARQLRAALEPLLLSHHVDVTWHGHHHSYQRTCAAARGRCVADACGPVHLVLGHAGADLTPNTRPDRPRIFDTVQLRHGYLRVRATREALEHVAIAADTGEVMDRVTMYAADRQRCRVQGAAAAM